jgi:hypothetical protein
VSQSGGRPSAGTRAMQWALTSEPVPAQTMKSTVSSAASCLTPRSLRKPRTAAHKALLWVWASAGLSAADEGIFDIALPLFESEDVKLALPTSVDLCKQASHARLSPSRVDRRRARRQETLDLRLAPCPRRVTMAQLGLRWAFATRAGVLGPVHESAFAAPC